MKTETPIAVVGMTDDGIKIANYALPLEDERAFIVTSQYGYGKGGTIRDALARCKQNTPRREQQHTLPIYRASLVHKSAVIDGLGAITRPAEMPPLQLGIVA